MTLRQITINAAIRLYDAKLAAQVAASDFWQAGQYAKAQGRVLAWGRKRWGNDFLIDYQTQLG